VKKKEKSGIVKRLAEFFVIGLMMGVLEDVLAIYFATDAEITLSTLKVAVFVAFPFAVISELVVDSKKFRRFIKRILNKNG